MKVTDQRGAYIGFLYTTKKMIHEITTNSGPLAKDNEYQVHYNSLTYRLEYRGSFVDISIPTVVYNYPQEVSSATIEFDMQDILDLREKLTPLDDAKIAEVNSKFHKHIKAFAIHHGYNLTILKSEMSNIHRHPGGMDSFSGTDYDKNPKNPGICFPFKSGNNTPVFSSIILHKNGGSELAHTEYRVATTNGDSLNYYKGDCVTICKGYDLDIPEIYNAFIPTNSRIPDATFTDGNISLTNPLTMELVDLLSAITYNPDTRLVSASNLKERTYTRYNYASRYSATTPKKRKEPSLHIGKYPKLSTFVQNSSKYADKLFIFEGLTYLGADLYDAYSDLDLLLADDPVTRKAIPDTLEGMLEAIAELGALDLVETYDELEPDLDQVSYNYQPKFFEDY